MAFVRAFLADPTAIGAVAASSAQLASRMVQGVADAVGAPVQGGVVEVGAGTGAFTGEIVRVLQPGWFVALEPHPGFQAMLQQRHPDVDVSSTPVEGLAEVLAQRGHDRARAVVSGLPFALWSAERQNRALGAIRDGLEPDGCMVTFGYLHSQAMPAAARLRKALAAHFREVRVSGFAWCNLPPALVWTARGTL